MVDQWNQLGERVHGGGSQARPRIARIHLRRVIPIYTRLRSDTDGDLPTTSPSAMILRNSSLWQSLAFAHLLLSFGVRAQDGTDPFDCRVRTNGLTYDLTPLQGEHTVSRTRETPPSSWVDSVRFDLCADLKLQDGVADSDQVCSHPNTRFRVAIHNSSVLRVVPVWNKGVSDKDEPEGRELGSCGGRDTCCSIEHS